MNQSFYSKYYQNALQNSNGFKLVLGGTGLGKTSGIIETIKQNPEENKRFFYVANRLQLLNEMVSDLDKLNKKLSAQKKPIIGYCLQERDEEIIKKINIADFDNLMTNTYIQKYIDKLHKGNANFVRQDYSFIQDFVKKENKDFSENKDFKNFFDIKVRNIFSFFRNILKNAATDYNTKAYNELIQNTTIKSLFPYIDFINNPTEKRIYLVSLQKAFYGFFNGKQTINLYKLRNDNEKSETNIIFLDEFDFLENDLLTQICKDATIEQPFSFVEYFYTVLNKYKLSREHFLVNHTDIRAELEKITLEVKTLSKTYGLPFPKINHFLCDEKQLIGTSIFQTRYSIGNFPIFLNHNRENHKKKKINSFYLEIANEHNKANAYVLLNVVNQTTSAIIRLFKNLEFEHPIIYKDLTEHCFGPSDKLKRILKQINQYPIRRISVGTNESKMYYNGFGLYEVCDLGFTTDREEVELKYYSIFTTPESILLHLTQNNLVFGLSATAEIKRYIKNFDLDWLKNELSIRDEQGNVKEYSYYEISEDDASIIQKANEYKFRKRKNQAKVHIAETDISPEISKLIDGFVHSNQQHFEGGKKQEFRKKRLVHFFATLLWISKNQKPKNTNILFFSSYKHILKLFQDWKEPENKVYKVQEITNSLKNCFQIHFEGRDFIVFFFDANQGKEITLNEKEQNAYYELFWRGLPVLLITTYPSAGNGVNLFFYLDQEKKAKSDFSNIHLLDSPYYFFNPINNNDDEQIKKEKIKTNIYYLAKLEKNKIISDNQFKTYLNNIRSIENFNSFYLSTPDGLSNRVSTYIQALGRIERVWEQMDTQTIRLEREVYNQLEDFATKDDCIAIFKKNELYFSQNIKALFAHILENKFGREYQQRQVQWEGLKEINNRCISEIKKLLVELNFVRGNKLPQERATQIRKEWQNLREYALRQSFSKFEELENEKGVKITKQTSAHKLFKKYACTFETDLYDHKEKCLWIQKDTLNILPGEVNPDSSFGKWNLDSAFLNVQKNAVLRGHFDLNQYEQGFSGKGIYFTPYFYQCILSGAIGEEVVKAVFQSEKINLTEKEIPNQLFELIDLKIKDRNWYIDVKNYSEQTITHFQLDEDDYFFHPKLNAANFKEKAQNKLREIINFHKKEDCKIIYINAFGNGERPTNYYDENFNEVDNRFEKSKIIVIQSMLKTGKSVKGDKNYSPDFQYFISKLKTQLNNG